MSAETCGFGHAWTPENTYRDPKRNKRFCRQCARRRQARHRAAAGARIRPTTEVHTPNLLDLKNVYFIGDGDCYVKIGVATDVDLRLSELQIGNPHELRVLLVVPGDAAYERYLHRRFKNAHVRGEWFRLNGEIVQFIDEHPDWT